MATVPAPAGFGPARMPEPAGGMATTAQLARRALTSCFLVIADRPRMPACLALRCRSGTVQLS